MARNLFIYQNAAYEGELDLYRNAHVAADRAQAVDSVGLSPKFVYRMRAANEALASITDDEVAMWRYVSRHPDAKVEVLRVIH
jgi:hypothetical protein